jgi:hypothetical protein
MTQFKVIAPFRNRETGLLVEKDSLYEPETADEAERLVNAKCLVMPGEESEAKLFGGKPFTPPARTAEVQTDKPKSPGRPKKNNVETIMSGPPILPDTTDLPGQGAKNYEAMPEEELRELAKERDIPDAENSNRDELVTALQASEV